MINLIHAKENVLSRKIDNIMNRYPIISYFMIFFGMPLLMLLCIIGVTTVITLPIAIIFGWL